MGDVVEFRPDPRRQVYEAEVREVCGLARMPTEQADLYIRRGTPREIVMSDAILHVFGKRLPFDHIRHMWRLTGRAGTRRRTLPKTFGRYGR